MRLFIKWIFSAVILIFISINVFSQPGGGGSPGDNDVPITGIEWVLGAGALLGARKMYNRRKRSSKDN